MADHIENRDRLIMLADMIADEYHLEPGLILNFEAKVGDRVIHVGISLKEAE